MSVFPKKYSVTIVLLLTHFLAPLSCDPRKPLSAEHENNAKYTKQFSLKSAGLLFSQKIVHFREHSARKISTGKMKLVGILKSQEYKSLEAKKYKKKVRFKNEQAENYKSVEKNVLKEFKAEKDRREGEWKLSILTEIGDFQAFLKHTKVDNWDRRIKVTNWDRQTGVELVHLLTECKGEHRREAVEKLIAHLNGLLAWPHQQAERQRRLDEINAELRQIDQHSPQGRDRRDQLELESRQIFALKRFHDKANPFFEKMVLLLRHYPVDYFQLNERTRKAREAIEKLILADTDKLDRMHKEYQRRKWKRIRLVETQFPEMTRCRRLVKRVIHLEGKEEDEWAKCQQDPDPVPPFWELVTADDWKKYFPKEDATEFEGIFKEMVNFREEMLKKFENFQKYDFIDAAIKENEWFSKFLFDETKLNGMNKMLARLKWKDNLRTVHWWISQRGVKARLGRQIKTLELLTSFGTLLNKVVSQMAEYISKSVHMETAKMVSIYMDLRLYRGLIIAIEQLFSASRLLVLAPEEKVREAVNFKLDNKKCEQNSEKLKKIECKKEMEKLNILHKQLHLSNQIFAIVKGYLKRFELHEEDLIAEAKLGQQQPKKKQGFRQRTITAIRNFFIGLKTTIIGEKYTSVALYEEAQKRVKGMAGLVLSIFERVRFLTRNSELPNSDGKKKAKMDLKETTEEATELDCVPENEIPSDVPTLINDMYWRML